jgi:phosphoenolpyruvate---glycerone phosphotransferase subunit DhaL
MLTLEKAKKWLSLFAKEIEANKQYLTELDMQIGDSDHGMNMARGVEEYQIAINEKNPSNLSELFKVTAMAILTKVGGASGPLYSTVFLQMAKYSDGKESLNKQQMIEMFTSGLAGLQMRGKAQVNEKTMIDVWHPVIEAMKNNSFNKETIDKFVLKTKDIKATKGRAANLGERSIGHIDPGSASSGMFFNTLIQSGALND